MTKAEHREEFSFLTDEQYDNFINTFQGEQLFIPRFAQEKREKRNEQIKAAIGEGFDKQYIANRYRLSMRQLDRILKGVKNETNT